MLTLQKFKAATVQAAQAEAGVPKLSAATPGFVDRYLPGLLTSSRRWSVHQCPHRLDRQ